MSTTYVGAYADGTPFRIVRPGGIAKQLMSAQGKSEGITIASMSGDGYAAHFDLVETTAPDKNEFAENRGTNFVSESESKAEALVITADSMKDSNVGMAQEHIARFLNLLEGNEIEFIKFEHIQNIVYGFIMAVELDVIDEDTANERLSELNLRFLSSDHIRYENGAHVSGPHGGARRGIEIAPNYEGQEGYLVTIYNQDGLHPVWGNNIQMGTKPMHVVKRTDNEIQLRGFGEDQFGNPFTDYAVSIHLVNNRIDFMQLHMLDRGVVIKYLK